MGVATKHEVEKQLHVFVKNQKQMNTLNPVGTFTCFPVFWKMLKNKVNGGCGFERGTADVDYEASRRDKEICTCLFIKTGAEVYSIKIITEVFQ